MSRSLQVAVMYWFTAAAKNDPIETIALRARTRRRIRAVRCRAGNATLLREPVALMPGVKKVTDLGTVCTISYQYQGQAFSFQASPQGRWHDVAAVLKGFNDFMKTIGRDDRCFELELGGEYALFVVAPAPKFEPVAARLGIPLERHPESARDDAKAFQKKVQNKELAG